MSSSSGPIISSEPWERPLPSDMSDGTEGSPSFLTELGRRSSETMMQSAQKLYFKVSYICALSIFPVCMFHSK